MVLGQNIALKIMYFVHIVGFNLDCDNCQGHWRSSKERNDSGFEKSISDDDDEYDANDAVDEASDAISHYIQCRILLRVYISPFLWLLIAH